MEQRKKSFFENPLLSTKVKSANVKIFPEGLLGYFIAPTLALLANSILAGYFNKYMSDVLGMTTWAKDFFNWLPVVSVIMVVLGNILIGRLMDHSKTRAGKARPILLLSIPVCVVALLVMFVFAPFPENAKQMSDNILLLVLIALGYNLWFAVGYPLYYTPHAALVNLSTRSSKDRSLLATISNATALSAMGLTSMILPFFMSMLFVPVMGADGKPLIVDGQQKVDPKPSYENWKVFVIALIIATVVGTIAEYFFTRERVTEESFNNTVAEDKKATPISKQFSVCFKDAFWWIIIVFFFLYQLGGMLKNVSQIYYCQAMFKDAAGNYTIENGGNLQGMISMIGAVPTALGMVISWPLSNKIGKGRAILFGAILSVIGGAIGYIDPTNFYIVVASFVVKALGSTPAMYLSLALLADVLDHQEAVHGVRTDGLTMTIFGAIMAGMTGIATGIMNMVLTAVGYDSVNGVVSNETIRAAMPWLFIGGETVCYGVIAIIFIFMGVEVFSAVDHRAIKQDQKAKAEADGVEYVDPAEKLKLEEAEAEAAIDEARKAELKRRCEKSGADFEQAEAKYQQDKAAKQAAAEAKKAAAEAKKAAAEKAKQDQFNALPDAQKAEIERKNKEKADKKSKHDAAVLKAFNAIRAKHNRPEVE